jgi:exosome complex RNA-binding protein Csl4
MEAVSVEVIKIKSKATPARSTFNASSLVIPGQPITAEQGYLRGHGTYFQETENGSELVASLAGQIERVNKLISVKPVSSRCRYFHASVSCSPYSMQICW